MGLQKNRSFGENEVCRAGGYKNIYPKSIIVTRTSFSTSVHVPGACSDGVEDRFVEPFGAGRYVNIGRDTLISQHFVEMLTPGRFVFDENREKQSTLLGLWLPLIMQEKPLEPLSN